MIARPRGLVVALLALAAIACSKGGNENAKGGNENVLARVEGSHLLIENRSGEAVHVQLVQARVAWIPASLPGNRMADGQSRRLRIAPSDRGQSVELFWWRPGKKIGDSDVRGPDRMRRVTVALPALTEPLADDELLIRNCVALGSESEAEFRERPPVRSPVHPVIPPRQVSERSCVEMAELSCASGRCAQELQTQERQLQSVRDARKRHRGDAGTLSSAAGPGAGAGAGAVAGVLAAAPSLPATASPLSATAREAFDDLAAGRIEAYLARMCPSLRETYSGSFMQGQLRKTADEFGHRGLVLGKASEEGKEAVAFAVAGQDAAPGGKPADPLLAIRATFGSADGRPCLTGIDQIR
ncbi:MAG: hypothetical protein KJZ83_16805 [Burkholderiaceae bacterium]|nr:hypothetical protein [Burkholderiaceae bacterium]